MRQVFTSQRLETVEGVARLLEDAGIGVHISRPRSYRSRRRGQFSYADPAPANQQPAVWVRIPEDQPRAREVLRQAGLMASTRDPAPAPTTTDAAPARGGRWAWRVRIGLLLAIAAVALFIWIGRRAPAPAEPAPAPPASPARDAGNADDGEEIRVRIAPPPSAR